MTSPRVELAASIEDEALVAAAAKVQVMDDVAALDRIAWLAFEVSRRANKQGRKWHELPEAERRASRAGIVRVLQAMVALGWLEP